MKPRSNATSYCLVIMCFVCRTRIQPYKHRVDIALAPLTPKHIVVCATGRKYSLFAHVVGSCPVLFSAYFKVGKIINRLYASEMFSLIM